MGAGPDAIPSGDKSLRPQMVVDAPLAKNKPSGQILPPPSLSRCHGLRRRCAPLAAGCRSDHHPLPAKADPRGSSMAPNSMVRLSCRLACNFGLIVPVPGAPQFTQAPSQPEPADSNPCFSASPPPVL